MKYLPDPDRPFFSVIVPVYNIAACIGECAQSLLAQDFGDFEVIFVDDGSTDGSGAICGRLAASDSRFRVISKENGGLSSARNAGIQAARGRYFLFVDGDDLIGENSLAKAASAIDGEGYPDIMFLGVQSFFDDNIAGDDADEKERRLSAYGLRFSREQFTGKPLTDVLALLAGIRQFHVSACFKAVSSTLFGSGELRFTEGIIGEDVDYSIGLYLSAKSFACADIDYYYYRMGRAGSIMTVSAEKSQKRRGDLLFIIEKWTKIADTLKTSESDNESGPIRSGIIRGGIIRSFLYHQYYILLGLCAENLRDGETRRVLKRYSYLLKYCNGKKKIIYIFCKIFGLRLTAKIIAAIDK